jgi:hypothetical protein
VTRWGHRIVRPTSLLLVLGLVLACAGCSGSPGEPSDPPASGAAPAAGFTATVTPGDGSLAITYSFTNQTTSDLIALNQVPAYSASGALTVDPGAVYVTGRGDDGRVEISKRAFAMPDTGGKVTWAAANIIRGVIVGPGKSIGETFRVPLALKRRFPYGDDLGDGKIALPDPVRDVVFCLGVVARSALPPTLKVDDGKVTTTHSAATTAAQHLFCSSPAKL